MRTLPLILLVIACAGCTSTWDLHDKYQGVIGAQYQTRSDCYIWKMARHEYDLEPFKLWDAKAVLGPAGTRLDFIPAGTKLKVLAAKRRYAGGDWDYLIAEIRAPRSGTKYVFEQLLGSSKFDPQEIDQFWKRLEQPNHTAEPASPGRGGSS
jgi:hypothetical protein